MHRPRHKGEICRHAKTSGKIVSLEIYIYSIFGELLEAGGRGNADLGRG
jgi:hypothetical protein